MSTTTSDVDTLASSTVEPEKQAQRVSKSFAVNRNQVLLLLGTALFAVSHFFLWWELRLNAPQFPKGLFIQATSYEIQDSPKTPFNDIDQVDGLNHYIGMMSLGDAARFEMSIAIPAIILFVILGVVAVIWKSRWSPLLVVPIVLFPFVYLADLAYWLWYAGHNLDPMAAITIEPFTPKALGTGYIAQFSTTATFQPGWYIALAASLVCLIAIVFSFVRKREA